MQPRHLSRRPRQRDTPSAPLRIVAPATSLTLPALPPDLVTHFEIYTGMGSVASFAESLLVAGIPMQWPRDSTLIQSVEAALTALCLRERPTGLVPLSLTVCDDLEQSLVPNEDYYARERNHKKPVTGNLAGLVVGVNLQNGLHVTNIGNVLRQLEMWPRLGQTVLHILSTGLGRCTNSINPHNALGWAESHYWRGDVDESQIIAEELDDARNHAKSQVKSGELKKMPTDQELVDQMEIFTRAKFDASIPREWTSDIKPLKVLPVTIGRHSLPTLMMNLNASSPATTGAEHAADAIAARWPAIRDACRAIQAARRHDTSQDPCESVDWVTTPFVLRYHDEDCIPQIMDDNINCAMEGDTDLSVNAVFLFHDQRTLADALKRLANYLRLTRACEELIQLLTASESHDCPLHQEIQTQAEVRLTV